ncbi:MAG: ABC transporter permease [Candidatus Schekmanbacteria bacterium]|nr:ABC transporter permease [Candidatus Schekmanbacteria bacterium]
MFSSAGFFLSQSVRDFKNHPYLHLSVVVIISLACFIFGIVLLFAFNLNRVVDSIYADIDVTVYLKPDIKPGDDVYKKIELRLKEDSVIESLKFVSSDEALAKFRKEMPDYNKLIDFAGSNPLPSSIEIKLKKNTRDVQSMERFVAGLSRIDGIEDVNITGDWINRFFGFLSFIKLVAGIIMLLIGVGVVFIIYNTVKITIHSRSTQIEIMKLIGATNWFIKGPFIFEGIWQGLGGSLLSVGILYAVYSFLKNNLEGAFSLIFSGMRFEFLDPLSIFFILGGGILLGICGGGISTAKFLRK